ncbi:cupin domain-containing protein [Halopelagius fulvigenes]|uniref:Cupin domain-containing protein n=1 Tax=Halopelagius fulvigenes TaxID=1198324 RepID=A0ABD5U463_9EURY
MERVSFDDAESVPLGDESEGRRLSDALGTTGFALNRYRLAPGEGFPGGLHAHADQEEVFVVVAGTATFETMAGELAVDAGEAVRFAPGEFQSGRNDSDGVLVAFAIGAPRESTDVRIPVACPDCGRDDVRAETDGGEPKLVCPDCGAERVPPGCPDCGGDELRATLTDGNRPVTVCPDCGAEFEEPPFRK